MYRKIVFVLAILMAFASIASGQDSGPNFSANTRNAEIVSTASAGYAADNGDSVNHHVELNTNDGTLSNAYVGTGSLAFGRSSITNSAYGTYADVERQVDGTPKLTFWAYDWGTSTPGTGQVAAWVNLDVHSANYIYGQSYARNNYGVTQNRVDIYGTGNWATISNYRATSLATPTNAQSAQRADAASGKSIKFTGYATNGEGDYSISNLKASGDNAYTYGPSTYGEMGSSYAYTSVSSPASIGAAASMTTYAQDRALAHESAGDVYRGIGQYGVQKNNYNWLQGSAYAYATASNVWVGGSAANVPYYQKAYMLEPYKYWAVNQVGQYDALSYQFSKLLANGWECTYYTDAAVTNARVGELDNYWFTTIISHMNNNVIGISRAGDSDVTAANLKSMITKSTGLVILNGCESFLPNSAGVRPLYEALKDKAWLSMGNEISVGVIDTGTYQKRFIDVMTDKSKTGLDRTARDADAIAAAGLAYHPPMTTLPSNHDLYLILS